MVYTFYRQDPVNSFPSFPYGIIRPVLLDLSNLLKISITFTGHHLLLVMQELSVSCNCARVKRFNQNSKDFVYTHVL